MKSISDDQLEILIYHYLKKGGKEEYPSNLIKLSVQIKKATKRIDMEKS